MIVFADDILQNQSVHSQDNHTELQHGVNTLVVWSSTKLLKSNFKARIPSHIKSEGVCSVHSS